MRVEILTIADCPNALRAREVVAEAVTALRLSDVTVSEQLIATEEAAAQVAFAGSPTVLVDGIDLEPAVTPTGNLACRIYENRAGMAGYPSVELVLVALMRSLATRAHAATCAATAVDPGGLADSVDSGGMGRFGDPAA